MKMKLNTSFLVFLAGLVVAIGLLILLREGTSEPELTPEASLRQRAEKPKQQSAHAKKSHPSAIGTATAAAVSVRNSSAQQVKKAEKGKEDGKPVRPRVDAETALKRWEDRLGIYTAEGAKERVKTTPVTVTEQEEMRELFSSLAPEAKLENIQHAVNLLPDETFPVVYGILFDTSQPPEVITALFHDLLNRDESLKNPVMEEIVKDKSHPMYVESARILDIVKDK